MSSDRMEDQHQHDHHQGATNPPAVRRSTASSKRLSTLRGMLVALSVFLSIQVTQMSASVSMLMKESSEAESSSDTAPFPDASFSAFSPTDESGRIIASVHQEVVNQRSINAAEKSNELHHPRDQAQQYRYFQSKISSATAANTTTTSSSSPRNRTFAACLLIKDDNDILNEWIAYHYHVLNLRFLIVATDPFSQTSPTHLLDQWRQPPFHMSILEWKDEQYMPDYFLQGHYDKLPQSFIPTELFKNPESSVWHKDKNNISVHEIIQDLVKINNHRFRQATFVSQCFRHFQQQQQQQQQQHSWIIHIDTDEYVVVNPRLRARPVAVKGIQVPAGVPYAGSLVQFLHDMYQYYPKRLLRSCLMMPTILFGAKEDQRRNTTMILPPQWNRDRFESLRWTYHARLNKTVNGLQKAIVDVSTLPDNHPIFVDRFVNSVHQPLATDYTRWKPVAHYRSNNNNNNNNTGKNTTTYKTVGGRGRVKQTCRHHIKTPNLDDVLLYPLTINHYVGSLKQYMSRQDSRRNVDLYQRKNNASVDVQMDDDQWRWIQGWLASFVETHGVEASRRVLNDYYYNPS